jgi:hypothetical protein
VVERVVDVGELFGMGASSAALIAAYVVGERMRGGTSATESVDTVVGAELLGEDVDELLGENFVLDEELLTTSVRGDALAGDVDEPTGELVGAGLVDAVREGVRGASSASGVVGAELLGEDVDELLGENFVLDEELLTTSVRGLLGENFSSAATSFASLRGDALPEVLPDIVAERASTAASLVIGVYLLRSVYYTRSTKNKHHNMYHVCVYVCVCVCVCVYDGSVPPQTLDENQYCRCPVPCHSVLAVYRFKIEARAIAWAWGEVTGQISKGVGLGLGVGLWGVLVCV